MVSKMNAACWLVAAVLPAVVACGAPPDGGEGAGKGETATAEPGAKAKTEYDLVGGGVIFEPADAGREICEPNKVCNSGNPTVFPPGWYPAPPPVINPGTIIFH